MYDSHGRITMAEVISWSDGGMCSGYDGEVRRGEEGKDGGRRKTTSEKRQEMAVGRQKNPKTNDNN